MSAYYNEIDPYAAAWLRNLIRAGHIAPGTVDERSIKDVCPDDLRGFTQCHFFAGIGVWSHALRRAGWPDDRPVWTGSCPCQPFSDAGKGAGFADERHLWPDWHFLVEQCRPPVVFGEQVASKDAMPWLDLVQDDLEGLDYAFGAIPFPSAGVGAPHIRDRLYWVADSDSSAREQRRADVRGWTAGGDAQPRARLGDGGVPSRMADSSSSTGLEGRDAGAVGDECPPVERSGAARRLADDDDGAGLSRFAGLRLRGADLHDADGRRPVGGFWANADWIPCRDNKWRPVEPGSFPLAHGAPARVGQLRAYGNAINAQAAQVWVECCMDALDGIRAGK